MFAVTRQFINSSEEALEGALITVSEYKSAAPVAFSMGGIGASDHIIRKTPVALDASGSMTITVYDDNGVRFTAYDTDGKTVLYQEDYNPADLRQSTDFLQGTPA